MVHHKHIARTVETDPAGMVARHANEAAKEFEQAAQRISDPQQRANLRLHRDGYVAWVTRVATEKETVLSASSSMADDLGVADTLGNEALESKDPGAFNRAAEVYHGLVDGWQGAGWIDQAKAVDLKRNWATDLAERALLQAPAADRLAAVEAATRPAAYDAPNASADNATQPAAGQAAPQPHDDLTQLARLLPADVQARVRHEARAEVERGTALRTWEKADQYERSMAAASRGEPKPPPWRAAIQADPDLDDLTRTRLLKQHDAMQRKLDAFWLAKAEYDKPDGRKFDVNNVEDRDFVEQMYTRLGTDAAALHAVVGRTGLMPDAARTAMLGDLASGDPVRVRRTVEQLDRLSDTYPRLIRRQEGGEELQYAVIQFKYELNRGATAEEAIQRIIQLQSSTYKEAWAAQRKSIDIDVEVAKAVSLRDLDGMPHAAPAFVAATFQIYSELVKDRFVATGDLALAKEQARDQLATLLGELDPDALVTKSDLNEQEKPSWLELLSETWPARAVQSAYKAFETSGEFLAGQDVSEEELIESTFELAGLVTGTSFLRSQVAKPGEVIFGMGATRRALVKLRPIVNEKASLGASETKQYRKTFLDAYPKIKEFVVVHHAIEQRVLKKYPGLITDSEMHSLQNLRGIPFSKNNVLHLGRIRREWNQFYMTHQNPTKKQLLDKATEIDRKYGSQFIPPRIFKETMLYT